MPKDLDDAVRIAEGRLPPDEAEELSGKKTATDFKNAVIADDSGVPDESDMPEWVKWPPTLKVARGKRVLFVRFRKELTDTPHLGDRVVILWSLSVADERVARRRAKGDDEENVHEMTKQMIRAIDAEVVVWNLSAKINTEQRSALAAKMGMTIEGKDADKFWNEIGAKCRNVLTTIYMQLHTLSQDELVDFFQHCTHASTAG